MKLLLSSSLLFLLASWTEGQLYFESALIKKANCLSTTYGFSDAERERLKSCTCETVVAAYDSDVYFADLILQTIGIPNREAVLERDFQFVVREEEGTCVPQTNPLSRLLTCTAQNSAYVGDLAHALLTRPWNTPFKEIRQLCSSCYDELADSCNIIRQGGGAGGGAGVRIYCVDRDTKTIKSTLFNSGECSMKSETICVSAHKSKRALSTTSFSLQLCSTHSRLLFSYLQEVEEAEEETPNK